PERPGHAHAAGALRVHGRSPRGRRPGEGARIAPQSHGTATRRRCARPQLAGELKPGSFEPAPWVAKAHLQTVYGGLAAPAPRPELRRERWDTPDGDFVDVDLVDGPAGSPWVHLYHGLEGSSNSPYARKLMAHVRARGWRGS